MPKCPYCGGELLVDPEHATYCKKCRQVYKESDYLGEEGKALP